MKEYNEIEIRIIASHIARSIRKDWNRVSPYAEPYLKAMERDDYGYDGVLSVLLRFLSNAGSYRGDNARAYKAELKHLISGL